MNKFKKFFYTFALLSLVWLTTPPFAEAQTARKKTPQARSAAVVSARRTKKKAKAGEKMIQTNTPVASGDWGAAGIRLTVEESGAQIQYDCASGEITEKLTVDADGNFAVNGTHTRLAPGPIRVGFEPKSQPARYEGKVSGGTMTFKVVLTESKTTVGEFKLELGKTPRLHRCL